MKQDKDKKSNYEFLGKTLFFPEQGILAIGDLHIGYEQAMMESGILLPEHQVKEVIESLEKVIEEIKSKKQKIKKFIFLGDIKHFFSYEREEKINFNKILEFLGKYVAENNIILIKGNHDTMDYSYGNMKDYYIEEDVAFLHGHLSFPEVFDKKVNIIVSGHLHPSIILEENPGVKHETYKCFLVGPSKGKTFIVMPSFLEFYEGTPINYYQEDFVESFSIIPKKDIIKFSVHVVGEDKVYDFGRVKDLN